MSIPVKRPYCITAVSDICPITRVCAYDVDSSYLISASLNRSSSGALGKGRLFHDAGFQLLFEEASLRTCQFEEYIPGTKRGCIRNPVLEHPLCRDVLNVGVVIGDGKGKGSKLVLSPAGHSTAPSVHRFFESSFEGSC